jgi:hypothetical protein
MAFFALSAARTGREFWNILLGRFIVMSPITYAVHGVHCDW